MRGPCESSELKTPSFDLFSTTFGAVQCSTVECNTEHDGTANRSRLDYELSRYLNASSMVKDPF